MAALAHLLGLGDLHERLEVDRLLLPFSCVRLFVFGAWDRQLGPVGIGDERLSAFEGRARQRGCRSLVHVGINSVGTRSTTIALVA